MNGYSIDDKKILLSFGSQLRACRNDLGISQEKLAELTNLHRTYIGSAERGERNISLINLSKLAKVLGVDPSALIP